MKVNRPVVQSIGGTRESTPDELLLKTERLFKPAEDIDFKTLELQTTPGKGDKQVPSSSLPTGPVAQTTEVLPQESSPLPTSQVESLVAQDDVSFCGNVLTTLPEQGDEIPIDHGPLKLVYLPRPKRSNTFRRRLRLERCLDKVSSFRDTQRYKLSTVVVTDVRTPCQRFCTLLEQMYGPGDIRRGDGRKPNKVSYDLVLKLMY